MPGYKANRNLVDKATLANFPLDATDEDMLGPFLVKGDFSPDNSYEVYVWRKNSSLEADGDRVIDGVQGQFIKQHSLIIGDFNGDVLGDITPIMDAMLLVDKNSQGNNPILYFGDGSNFSWQILSSPTRVTSNSDPDNPPDFEGQMWVNKSDGTLFIGTDVNSKFGWLKFTGEPTGSGT